MVAFCAMVFPRIAKIAMPNASDNLVKADKEKPTIKMGPVDHSK
jgi:hypothetical protein